MIPPSKTSANGRYAQITGWGMSVPEKVLTNADLARVVDTTDEWIVSRTGIKERRVVAGERESTATLAIRAAREALLVAQVLPAQIDLIIVATATPEYAFPATASLVQDALGASAAGAFDLSAGCSGFIYALSVAASAVRSGSADHVLVVGSETLSRITDWTDRNTCVLFGDGAGAVVVSACNERCGVLATELGSDGSGGDLLIVPGGGSHRPACHESVSDGSHFIKMNGREVFRFATTVVPRATEAVARKAGWKADELDIIIPHQANVRIIESAAKRLSVPVDKFFVNLERYGNTSAASIPIALTEAIRAGRVKPGDRMVMVGFGAGLTWAAAALEWGVPIPTRPLPWWRRLFSPVLWLFAGLRSVSIRTERRVYNQIMGPVGKDDWRGHLRRHTDTLRRRVRAWLKR
ncbi:MAG: 3-oxoacyl-(acyl-carrier-protein) synthase 3 [Chloroflexi bacterium ADurb.Bin325]|nr:MAG: 3-oxoacyl-(acyl-carrier-protein) synthase 3 [Chloroflexi bacterium ADurb.Bin325]